MTAKLFDLTGKVAIVTGGNGGIGLGMARGLAEAGAAIAIVGRNEAKSNDAVAELRAARRQGDLRGHRRHRQGRRRRHGRARQYANSAASTFSSTTPASTSASRRRRSTSRNGTASSRPTSPAPSCARRRSIPHEGGGRRQDHQYRLDDVDLRRQLRAGLCREQRRHRAVHPLLRLAWAADNIQANAVLPGWIDTDLTKRAREQIDGLHDKVLARTPAARWGAIDDFAGIAVFLSSSGVGLRHRHRHSRRWRLFGDGLISASRVGVSYPATAGERTCSGRTPRPRKRAVMPCSHGTALITRANSGTLSG